MRNYPEWSLSWWACQAIGAIAVSLNAWWTESGDGVRARGRRARGAADRRRAAGAAGAAAAAPGRLQAAAGRAPRRGRRGRRGLRRGHRIAARRPAGRRRRSGRSRHHPLHLGHDREPEGGDGDASQPRHQPDEHASWAARVARMVAGVTAAARSGRAAARRAADLPVLPHRRPVGSLRRRGDRHETGADVQVGAGRGRPAGGDPQADQRRRRADRRAPVAGDRARWRRRHGVADGRRFRRRAGAAGPDPPHRRAVPGQGRARQRLRPHRDHQRSDRQRRRRLSGAARQRRPADADGRRAGGRTTRGATSLSARSARSGSAGRTSSPATGATPRPPRRRSAAAGSAPATSAIATKPASTTSSTARRT